MTIMKDLEEWVSKDAANRSVEIEVQPDNVVCKLRFRPRGAPSVLLNAVGVSGDIVCAVQKTMDIFVRIDGQNDPIEAPKRSTLDRSNWDPWQTLKMRDFPFAGSTDK